MTDKERFGFSLAIFNGDIVLDAASGALKTIRSKPNLIQALELRLLTPLGSDPFNVRYGLDIQAAFTQPGTLRMTKDLLRLSVVKALAADPRVQDIREVLFEDDPRYLARHPGNDLETVAQNRCHRFWQIEVIIVTIQGETEALSFKIGV